MVNLYYLKRRWLIGVCFMAAMLCMLLLAETGHAQELSCSPEFQITHTFTNEARWEMCYEERLNEGIVYYDIYYTTSHNLRRKVLGQMNLAQIHVPYDDNSNRYHDVSDFGLSGETSQGKKKLLTLGAAECEEGTLYQNTDSRNVICLQAHRHGYAWKDYVDYEMAESMTVFNVSRIQRYYYIIEYEFHDNGQISPNVAATGRIQAYIYSNSSSFEEPGDYGWQIYQANFSGTASDIYGTNHAHNYWWRLDFDLAGSANDVFEEIEFIQEANDTRRRMEATTFVTETARVASQDTFRLWRVKDSRIQNGDGHAISYDIAPNSSNIFRGTSTEPFTMNNIYVTNSYACERFISRNTAVAGCGNSVDEFVNGEVLTDTVVWYGATFHHLTRDEDDSRMAPHKEGFHITPRDWTDKNPVDMKRLDDVQLRISTAKESSATLPGLNTNIFLVATSFVFVAGIVVARQKTRREQ